MAKPTVLDSFESSDLVVAARLTGVQKTREKEREYDIGYIRSVTMVVTKVFKGNIRTGQELKFAQGGGADCIWTFDEEWVGDEFLFYLGKPTRGHPFHSSEEDDPSEPMYRAVTCGRSNSLTGAIDDLAYLENIGIVKGKTRLSGRFGTWFDRDFPREGIKLTVEGKGKKYKAKTDKNGFFELYDLPPGEFIASIDLPFGWKLNDYMIRHTSTGYQEYDPKGERRTAHQVPIKIEKGRHTALDLTFDIDTAITGKVLSPLGKPMSDVCVKAVSTELKEGDWRGQFDCTDKAGNFVLDEMAPGNYILVLNDDGQMDANQPFGRLFYPGVAEFKNAGVLEVKAGKYTTNVVIQIPEVVELVTISGSFLYSDGKPVAGEWVKFTPDDEKRFGDMRQETDAAGKFNFRLPKGSTGKIQGEISTYAGKFKNCSKLEAIIKESGSTWYNAKSTILEVSSVETPPAAEIFLAFPFCERAEKDK